MPGHDAPSAVREYTLGERLLIAPATHTRVTDVSYQTEMYELFHRTAGARAGHLIATPAILLGVLMVLARAGSAAGPVLAIALVLVIATWGAVVDRLVGCLTAIAGALLAVLAVALVAAVEPRAFGVAMALVFGGCAVQTLSHLFEDVPPPQSGTTAFVPVVEWMRNVDRREILRSTVLTLTVFYWLELWSAPRIWPLQILHLAMRAGYRPELRRRLDARIAEILAAPASRWQHPRAG